MPASNKTQQFHRDIFGADHRLTGQARIGTHADDAIKFFVFRALGSGQALATLFYVNMAGAAFGLALAFMWHRLPRREYCCEQAIASCDFQRFSVGLYG